MVSGLGGALPQTVMFFDGIIKTHRRAVFRFEVGTSTT